MRERLIIASANPGKLREFESLLAGLPFSTESQTSLGIAAAAETAATFLQNALLKARHAAAAGGAAALADDSGLEVDALGGAPGVYSARYAGCAANDAANNAKLVAALAGLPAVQRSARYRCALVFVLSAEDPAPLFAEGVWEGYILDAPRGTNGFGYDPYFWLPEHRATAAELRPEDKNRWSHRAIAMHSLRERLLRRAAAAGAAAAGP